MIKKLSLIFVVAFLMSGFFVKPVEARAIPIRVPANVEWVDTGIDVVDGETYILKAKGQAITGPLSEYPDAKSGPEGQETICGIDGGAVPSETCRESVGCAGFVCAPILSMFLFTKTISILINIVILTPRKIIMPKFNKITKT